MVFLWIPSALVAWDGRASRPAFSRIPKDGCIKSMRLWRGLMVFHCPIHFAAALSPAILAVSFRLAHQFLSVGGLPISPAASRLGRTGALHVHRYSLPGVPPYLSYESLSKTNSSFHLVPMGGVGPPLILTVIIRLAPSCGSHRHFKKWLAALPAIKGPCPPPKLKYK